MILRLNISAVMYATLLRLVPSMATSKTLNSWLQNCTTEVTLPRHGATACVLCVWLHIIIANIVGPFLPRCMKCRRGLAMRILSVRSSVRLSVCLSVCLSHACIYCDKTVERSVQIFTPFERTFSLVFWEEEWLVGATRSTWNFGSTDPRRREIAYFQQLLSRNT